MKNVRSYEAHKNLNNSVNEAVYAMDDNFMIVTTVSVPKSLVNSYVKKVKDMTSQDLKVMFGEQTIAEELVKYVNKTFLDTEKLPANALTGGPDPQTQMQAQLEPQAQTQMQAQAQLEPQVQVQNAVQGQDAVQAQIQAQDAVQAQGGIQVQPQAQGEFSDIQDEDDEVQTEENDLPI